MTCASRAGSASSQTGSSATFVWRRCRAAAMAGEAASIAAVIEAVQRDDLAAEVDLAARDPRDVEEVVDQPRHVIELPLDDGDRATGLLAEALALEQRQRVPDWCKRVAQLVGEDRDEIVLAVVGVSQGLFGTPAIGDVGADARMTEKSSSG